MAWGKMDDKFHRNKKVRKLRRMGRVGREALGIWAFWWSWCLDDPELNGVIPEEELDKDELKLAALLCSDLYEGRGLWVQVDGGFQFHDFHEYNPTKEQVDGKKRADRERVAEKRHASRDNVASDIPANLPRVASTRDPIPSQPIGEGERASAPPPSSATDQPGGISPDGGVYWAELWDTWSAEALRQGYEAAPRPNRSQQPSAVAVVRELAVSRGVSFAEAAQAHARRVLAASRVKPSKAWFDFMAPTPVGPGLATVNDPSIDSNGTSRLKW